MKKFAVFASGSGTNFEAIERRMREENWDAEIVLVVCDKPDAKVLERAEKAGIPSFAFQPKSFDNKAAFEQVIVEQAPPPRSGMDCAGGVYEADRRYASFGLPE